MSFSVNKKLPTIRFTIQDLPLLAAEFLVLCSHTHHAASHQTLTNLIVKVGETKSYQPKAQKIFTVQSRRCQILRDCLLSGFDVTVVLFYNFLYWDKTNEDVLLSVPTHKVLDHIQVLFSILVLSEIVLPLTYCRQCLRT